MVVNVLVHIVLLLTVFNCLKAQQASCYLDQASTNSSDISTLYIGQNSPVAYQTLLVSQPGTICQINLWLAIGTLSDLGEFYVQILKTYNSSGYPLLFDGTISTPAKASLSNFTTEIQKFEFPIGYPGEPAQFQANELLSIKMWPSNKDFEIHIATGTYEYPAWDADHNGDPMGTYSVQIRFESFTTLGSATTSSATTSVPSSTVGNSTTASDTTATSNSTVGDSTTSASNTSSSSTGGDSGSTSGADSTTTTTGSSTTGSNSTGVSVQVILSLSGDPANFDLNGFKTALANLLHLDPSLIIVNITTGSKRATNFQVVVSYQTDASNQNLANTSYVTETIQEATSNTSSPIAVSLTNSGATVQNVNATSTPTTTSTSSTPVTPSPTNKPSSTGPTSKPSDSPTPAPTMGATTGAPSDANHISLSLVILAASTILSLYWG